MIFFRIVATRLTTEIPYVRKQGNYFTAQGILTQEQGIPPAPFDILTG